MNHGKKKTWYQHFPAKKKRVSSGGSVTSHGGEVLSRVLPNLKEEKGLQREEGRGHREIENILGDSSDIMGGITPT